MRFRRRALFLAAVFTLGSCAYAELESTRDAHPIGEDDLRPGGRPDAGPADARPADAAVGQCTPGARRECQTACGSTGSQTCDDLHRWPSCTPPAEVCGNRRDDDCDGQVDEGCQECIPRTKRACTASCGSTGEQTCDDLGRWPPTCTPPGEVCGNGRDDDCDGDADEDCTFACEDFVGGNCGGGNM